MKKIWNISTPDKELQQKIARECGITPVTAQLLINRGITDPHEARSFLNPSGDFLHDPSSLKDIGKAVKRIRHAVSKGEKIMIYGDYDVDGVTAVALMKLVLREMGANVVTYIPDRVGEGYGLNKEAVRLAQRRHVSLLITVDCGISGRDEVGYLAAAGIDTVITDHHKIVEGMFPGKAYAAINPLQEDCHYPFKYLSGAAVAYKLAQALTADSSCGIRQHLDLVALGTIQDMVPQLGENRILTKLGLDEINNSAKKGIQALIEASGLKGRLITSKEIAYIIGPRINAAGRVGSADMALRLLTSDDALESCELAEALNDENYNRQKIEAAILREAIRRVENEVNFSEEKVIVLDGDGWHPGVIGIVASRIAERFNRPAIMISFDGKDEGKGSGRSIKNFHLFEALAECRNFLTEFGGHAAACGLKIARKDLEEFRKKLNNVAADFLESKDFIPVINIDMEVPLRALKEKLISELESLSPFGPGNPPPLLSTRSLKLKSRPRRLAKDGVKMLVTDDSVTCEAVAFGISDMFEDICECVALDAAYTPSVNKWGGLKTLQLDIVDIKPILLR